MDIVFVHGLRIDTVIGVYDWERNIRQTIILDLDMSCNVKTAALHDCIDDTLDYKAVTKRLIQFISDSNFNLVETLAERCAELLMNEFAVRWLRIKVNKPGAVRSAQDVGVIIERTQCN